MVFVLVASVCNYLSPVRDTNPPLSSHIRQLLLLDKSAFYGIFVWL